MKTFIAVPCMDIMHTAFFVSYNQMRRVGSVALAACQNSLIYDARNRLGESAMQSGADRILWLDTDLVLPEDLMERLSEDIDSGYEYVSALVFKRVPPHSPVVYDRLERSEESGRLTIDVSAIKDWPHDQLFEIAGSGFAATMMTTDLYRRVYEEYGLPFSPMIGFGEDLSFCWRARQLGAKLYCDARVRPKHIGTVAFDETHYLKTKGE